MKKPPKPTAPEYLSDKAKAIWKEIMATFELEVEMVERMRVGLENLDLGDIARANLRTNGHVLADGKKNPALDAVKLHDGLFLRAFAAIGLDVVAPGKSAGRKL